MSAEDLKVGKLITSEQDRDAIHVPILPVVASEDLSPGQHVGLSTQGKAMQTAKPIGVVDPFLTVDVVHKGEMFWLCLYPGSITSLRHEWTHPSLGNPLQKSIDYIEDLAGQIGLSYSALINAAAQFVQDGEHTHMGSNEDYHDVEPHQWQQFWHHYSKLSPKSKLPDETDQKHHFFSCAC